jgi:PIN domain
MTPFQVIQVFLDTEVFAGEAFDFTSTKLAVIRSLAADGKIKLLTTSVTERECKQRIEKFIREAKNLVKKLRFHLGILSRTSFDVGDTRGKIDVAALTAELDGAFDQYLLGARVEKCDAMGVSVSELMDGYFEGKPPFGPDQKKDQFPDAVAVLILAKRAAKDARDIHVVSGDPDLKAACQDKPSLVYVQSLTEFLDLYNPV